MLLTEASRRGKTQVIKNLGNAIKFNNRGQFVSLLNLFPVNVRGQILENVLYTVLHFMTELASRYTFHSAVSTKI